MGIHHLKQKKKNINRQLGIMHRQKHKLIETINQLENAKLKVNIALDTLTKKNIKQTQNKNKK